jgi:hypothetical protein
MLLRSAQSTPTAETGVCLRSIAPAFLVSTTFAEAHNNGSSLEHTLPTQPQF